MKNEIIMLIAGVILGFGASIGTIKYQEYLKKGRALKICKIELFKINKLITPLILINNNINGISPIITPNFRITTELDIFLSLDDSLRKSIYDISIDLESAENYRKLAHPLLIQKNMAAYLEMYGTAYIDYLRSALDKIDKLNYELKEI